jgi:hypothetical protein
MRARSGRLQRAKKDVANKKAKIHLCFGPRTGRVLLDVVEKLEE